MKTIICVAAMAVAMATTPASATDYTFDFSGPNLVGSPATLAGSGVFNVSDTSVDFRGRTAYAITGISGMFNGSAITGLLTGFLGATNYYYLDSPFLDGSGVSFKTAAGTSVNFFNQSSNGQYRVNTAPYAVAFVTATSSVVQSAVPEPASWALLLFGFAAVGGALRGWQRKQSVAVRYA